MVQINMCSNRKTKNKQTNKNKQKTTTLGTFLIVATETASISIQQIHMPIYNLYLHQTQFFK